MGFGTADKGNGSGVFLRINQKGRGPDSLKNRSGVEGRVGGRVIAHSDSLNSCCSLAGCLQDGSRIGIELSKKEEKEKKNLVKKKKKREGILKEGRWFPTVES